MSRRPAAPAVLAALALLAAALAPGSAAAIATAGAADSSAGPAGPDTPAAGGQSFDDRPPMTLRVQLLEDGDARWNVTARFPLTDANETAAFEELAAAFRDGEAGPSYGTFEAIAAEADARVDRSVGLSGPERNTTVRGSAPDATGVLTLTFTWENFARVDGEFLHVGDVFDAWTLGADQRLAIAPPDDYGLLSAEPGTDGVQAGGPVWTGPEAFSDGEPRITYEAGSAPTMTTTAVGPTEESVFDSVLVGAGAIGLLLVLGLFAVWWRRRDDDPGDGSRAPTGPTAGPSTGDAGVARQTADEGGTGGPATAEDPGSPGDAAVAGGGEEDGSPGGAPAGASADQHGAGDPAATPDGTGATGSTVAGSGEPAASNGDPGDVAADGTATDEDVPEGTDEGETSGSAGSVGADAASEGDAAGSPAGADGTEEAAAAAGTAASDGESEGESGADGREAGDEEEAGEEGEEEVPMELLSDEERVERLLSGNDGRMRQADIVTETGWSNAKVSQLLSGMADEGRIEKLRMGRENLISLEGHEAAGDESPESDGSEDGESGGADRGDT